MSGKANTVEELQRDKRIAAALLRIAEQMGDVQALPDLLGEICSSTVELVGCDRCAIYLWNERRAAFVPIAHHGTPSHLLPRFAARDHQRDGRAFKEELLAGATIAISRDQACTPEQTMALAEAEVHALAVVPLPGRGQTLGSLTLALHRPPGFTADALAVARRIASQAAPLIASARLFIKLKKAAAFRAALAQLAADVAGEGDPVALARLVCDRGAALFGVNGGGVFVRQGDALVALAATGSLAERAAPRIPLGDDRLPSVRALRSGRPLFINDVHGEHFPDHALVNVLGLKAFLAVPLVGRGQLVGCLLYGDTEQHFPFSRAIADEGTLLAGIATAAIERCYYAHVEEARERAEQQTTELVQRAAELTLARNAALEVAHAKAAFLAHMSHEIRTPMTAILGYVNVLADPRTTESERTSHLQTIRRNGQHLLRIINDILDLSKMEAGRMVVESVECWPLEILDQVVSLMKPRAVEKGLTFAVDYGTPMPERIRADPTRLRQILINLLGNAIKFTEVGGIRFHVEMDPAAGLLRFRVIDTGVGLSPEAQARLFTPFTQGDPSTTRRFGGTGLGLAISKRLAEMLGGDITVQSKLERGSTFVLTLPTGPLDGVPLIGNPAEFGAAQSPVRPEVGADLAVRARILVVEDAQDNQRLFEYYLRKAGAEVAIADNGARGCEAALGAVAAGKPFDVILMDVQMPEVDGYEATRRLRAAGYRRPIIALTAHALETDRASCLAAGCDDFVTKPVDPERLIEAILQHVGQGQGEREAAYEPALVSTLGDNTELRALVEIFLGGLPVRIESMERCLAEENFEQLLVEAHRLKGTAGGYGFPTLTEAAANLEASTRARLGVQEIAKRLQRVIELSRRAAVRSAA